MTPPDDAAGVMWVTTEPMGHGRYTTTIHFTEDNSLSLRPKEAEEYTRNVLTAAARAEHDAAVIAQLVGQLKVPLQDAGWLVTQLRQDRAPLLQFGSLTLDPGVAQDAGVGKFRPFIGLYLDDNKYGQLDPAGARSHAMHVMESPISGDLDGAYRTLLTGQVGASDFSAMAAVQDLAEWRYGA